MPKLFVDYVGMGGSDKPKDYVYSAAQRADLVEAIWHALSVQSTTLVAFDFSSLLVLELLRRRLERPERGETTGGPDIRGFVVRHALCQKCVRAGGAWHEQTSDCSHVFRGLCGDGGFKTGPGLWRSYLVYLDNQDATK
jgi:pimeloyl-ACP methyl ester carboxylesterase